MDAFIELRGVSKRFGELVAVKNTDLILRKGEVFSLLGPSGCGKTTLLRLLAGFLTPDAGEIMVNGRDLTKVPPNRRPINTVFQNYALFPHLTIRGNIAFGLEVARRPKAEIRREVERMLDLIQMTAHADKRPGEISGGQKQRVAIARALINKPALLLLDEPLAALDLKLRQRMLLELDRIHDEVGITFLYVTHDQGEAMSLSDRLAVMDQGQIEQTGTPAEIYESPRSRFVADFIGDTNFLSGPVSHVDDSAYVRLAVDGLGAGADRNPTELLAWKDRELKAGEFVNLSLRPEKIIVSRERPPEQPQRNILNGIVEDKIYLGAQTQFRVLDTRPISWNESVWLSWHADDGYMIVEDGT